MKVCSHHTIQLSFAKITGPVAFYQFLLNFELLVILSVVPIPSVHIARFTVATLLSPPPPTQPPPAWLHSKIVIHKSLCNGVQIAHDRRGKTFSHHPSSETKNNDIKVQREFLFTTSMAKVFFVFAKAVLTSPCVWS